MNFTVIHTNRIIGRSPDLGINACHTFPLKKQWSSWFAPPLQWWVRSGFSPDSLFSLNSRHHTFAFFIHLNFIIHIKNWMCKKKMKN